MKITVTKVAIGLTIFVYGECLLKCCISSTKVSQYFLENRAILHAKGPSA